MKGCKNIRQLIDEAEKPNVFSIEVNQHLRQCAECESFADQRAGLRKLLGSTTRVSAPVNFNVQLNERLAVYRTTKAFSWLNPALYMRLGAATAGVLIAVVALQYSGVLSSKTTQLDNRTSQRALVQPNVPSPQPIPLQPKTVTPQPIPFLSGPDLTQTRTTPPAHGNRSPRGSLQATARASRTEYPMPQDGGVVLVKGTGGDMDVQMPTVSVGAQPLLLVSAGKHPARNAGASF